MKDNMQHNYCNCQIPTNRKILKEYINHSFCQQCGSILLKGEDNKIYYTMKAKQKIKSTEFNPISIIKSMKKKTEFEYPHINNDYNMSEIESYNQEKLFKSINIYLKHRKMIILTLQKMMKMLDYSDLIFYQCLFYMDTYLSHNINEHFSEKTILYYLVGYFLCSAKLKETDIYEPSLDSFCCLKKKVYLSTEKILYYEVICLQSIKYNIFSYSAYDWISELVTIGFVFDCEINKNNSIILINGHRHSILNTISKYAMKMLLNITVKDIFIKYSPMYIAFSLLQIAREKYLDKSMINPQLFNQLINLYGVDFNDYKKCYKELKSELEEIHESNKILEIEKKEEKMPKNKNAEIEKLKKMPNDDTLAVNAKIDNKKVVAVNKMKSSNAVISLKEVINKGKEKLKELEKEKEKEKEKESQNNEKEDDDFSNDISKDDSNDGENIIIFEEQKDEKDNLKQERKLILSEDEPKKENDLQNKLKPSLDAAHTKVKNKTKLFINCNSFKSNDNLPKIDIFDTGESKENIRKSQKHSSSKETNRFLHTHTKTLNPIKGKNSTNTTDNKRYFQSNFSNSNNNNNSAFKPKEELDNMRKSLFCDNVNNNKKINLKEGIGIFNKNINKMKSTNIIPKLNKLENIIKDDIKLNNQDEEIKNNNINETKKKEKCKSKGKSKNNLLGKETKINVASKRNQSTDNNKRKTFFKANTLKVNSNTNKINMIWKNN